MLPANSITPDDSLVAPITAKLTVVAQQIQGIGECYPQPPETPPEDNSVLFVVNDISIDDASNGLMVVKLEYEVVHVFRRGRLQDQLTAIYPFLRPWITVFTARSNMDLDGLAQNLTLKQIRVLPYKHANQVFLGITSNLTVKTVLPIDLS